MTARARSRRKLNLGKLSPLRLRLPEDSQAPGPHVGKAGWGGEGEAGEGKGRKYTSRK